MSVDLESLRSRFSENPNDNNAFSELETALIESGELEEAKQLNLQRCEELSEEESREALIAFCGRLEAYAEGLEDASQIAAILVVSGSIYEKLEDADEAIRRYQGACQYDQTCKAALEAAQAIYVRQENWPQLLQVLDFQLQNTEGDEARATLMLEMADVCLKQPDGRADALSCVREALRVCPDHPRASEFSELLETTQITDPHFAELCEEAEKVRDARQKSKLLVEAAEYGRQQNHEDPRIRELLDQAISLDPRNDDARNSLLGFFEDNHLYGDMIELLAAAADATPRKPERLEIYHQIAYLALNQMAQPAVAAEWHRKVLKLDPADEESMEFCVSFYSETESWQELAEIYDAALRARSRKGDEAAMLLQIAMLYWKKVGDFNAADGYFKRIKLNDPHHPLMLTFYTEFYTATEDWKRLLTTLQARQAIQETDEQRIEIGLQMAEVAEEKQQNLAKAIDIWRSILKLDPTHQQARAALRRLLYSTAKWNALLELLKEDLALCDSSDVEQQVSILEQTLAIYRDHQNNQPQMVINLYNQILSIDPENEGALSALQEKYEQGGRWNDLIGILKRRADLAEQNGDDEACLKYLREIAQLLLTKQQNVNQAIPYLESILERSPTDEATIEKLIEIYRHFKNWRALYNIYERQLDSLEGPVLCERLKEMAQIAQTRLEEPDEALKLWQRILDEDPKNEAAWVALEELYQKGERYADLADLYEVRVEQAQNDEAKLAWLKKLGQIFAERLQQEERAVATWREVLDLHPGDLHAEAYLREVYLSHGDYDALTEIYSRRNAYDGLVRLFAGVVADVSAASEEEEIAVKVDLYRRMAEIYADKLSQRANAVECWEAILDIAPTDKDAASKLAPVYRELEQHDSLVHVLEILLDQEFENPVEVMCDLAQVHENGRHDLESAYHWYARAFEAKATDGELLKQVRRTASLAQAEESLADLLDAQVDTLEGEPLEATLRVLAEVSEEPLGRSDEALSCYERLRELQGDTSENLNPLERLYERVGQFDNLLEVRAKKIELSENVEEKIKILLSVAELHESVLCDDDKARETFLAIGELEERNLDALHGLQRLADRATDYVEMSDLVEKELSWLIDAEGSNEDQAELLFRLGELAVLREEPVAAIARFGEVLEKSENHGGAQNALEGFLDGENRLIAAKTFEKNIRQTENWSKLVDVLEIQVEESDSVEESVKLLRELAQIRETRESNREAAMETYERLLLKAADDELARNEYERLCKENESFEGWAKFYQRLAIDGDNASENDELSALYSLKLAILQEEKLGDNEAAAHSTQRLCEEQGDSRELLDRLDRLYTNLNDWTALIDVCERKIALLGDSDETTSERIELLFRIAQLHEDMLQEPSTAIETYQRVRGIESENAVALESLERIFVAEGRYNDLAEMLEGRIENADDALHIALSFQLAGLLVDKLEDPNGALKYYADVLNLEPEHKPTVEALEALLIRIDGDSFEEKSLRSGICDLLESVYKLQGDWKSQIRLRDTRLNDVDEKDERRELHMQLVALYENQGNDGEAALDRCGVAFAEDFGQADILAELERLAAKLGSWSKLIEILRAGLDDADQAAMLESEQRIQLLSRVAELYETKLSKLEDAVVFNRRVLDEDADYQPALVTLDRLYTALDDLEPLAEVLERRGVLLEDADEQSKLYFRLGALYEERLEDTEKAITAYAHIHEDVAPTDLRAHAALERLYTKSADFEKLVVVLRDHAEQVAEIPEKKRLLFAAAEATEMGDDNREQAIEIYREVCELDETDRDALSNLDRLYAGLGRQAELLDVLERELALAENESEQNEIESRMGSLLADESEFERAVSCFESVLKRNPHHEASRTALEKLLSELDVRLKAANLLDPIYAMDGEWTKLRDLLRGTLDDLSEPAEQVATLRRIAELEEGKLADEKAAFASLSEAYRLSGAELSLELELERLAMALSEQEALADLLSSVVDDAPDRAVQIHLKVAAIAEERLEDLPRAIEHHREVISIEPENTRALNALERLYDRTAQYRELIEILERKLEQNESLDHQKPIFERMAVIKEELLSEPSEAIEVWRRLLAAEETDVAALDNLERLLESEERWSELASLCEHRASVEKSPEARRAVEFRLARICEMHLKEGERALDLYRGILEEDPCNEGVCLALAGLFAEQSACDEVGVDRLQVACMLEPIYRQIEALPQLVDVLELRQSLSDDVEERLTLLREIATLREENLGADEEAFESRTTIMQLAPEDEENRVSLIRLSEKLNKFETLSTVFEDAASGADDELRITLLMELGFIEETHRRNDERARDVFREVLTIEPHHAGAVQALVELFSRLASWEELVQLYFDLSETYDEVEQKIEVLFKVAALLDEVVGDRDRAINVYRTILENDPSNAQAFKKLELFFTEGERWQDLADLLASEVEEAKEDKTRADLRDQLAKIQYEKLNQRESAIESWRQALEDSKNHESSFNALKFLVSSLEDNDECCLQAAEILEPLYAESESFEDWVKVNEIKLVHQQDVWQRAEILKEIAKVEEEKLDDKSAAFSAYSRAFAEDFGNEDLQKELDRLAEDTDSYQKLVDVYLAGIDGCSDVDTAIAILLKVAGLYDEKLGQVEKSIETYRRALEQDDSNKIALDALERLLAGENRYQELCEVLDTKAELSDSWDEKRAFLVRICKLYEGELANNEKAIENWRRVFDEDADDVEAIESLIKLYRTTEDWPSLIEMLQVKLDRENDDAKRIEILYEIADIWEAKRGENEEAISQYRAILEIDVKAEKANENLERLYKSMERYEDLVELLESQRDAYLDDEPARVNHIEMQIAGVLAEKLDQGSRSVELYSGILERAEDFVPACEALEDLAKNDDLKAAACHSLATHYENVGKKADLVRILEASVDLDENAAERFSMLQTIAALHLELGENDKSFEAQLRSFSADPSNPDVVTALHELADELNRHAELAELYENEVDNISDGELRREVHRRLARLYDAKLGQVEKAVAHFECVVEAEPFDQEALEALDRLYQVTQNWTAMIGVLRARIQAGGQENEADLRFRLGYLLEAVANEVPEAIELYRTVLWEHPEHMYCLEAMERLAVNVEHRREIAEVLDPIYRDSKAFDKLAILTEMRIELCDDPAERARLWSESAAIRENELNDKVSAFQGWLLAFEENSTDEDIRSNVERLAAELGEWACLRQAFDAAQNRVDSPDQRLDDLLKMAKWSLENLNQPEIARNYYEKALEIDDANATALDALESIFESAGAWSELCEIERKKIDQLYDLDDKKARLHKLGALCAEKLNDSDSAISAYEQILEIDENDEKALSELEELHEKANHYEELARVLERRLDNSNDDATLVKIHRRLAALYREHLNNKVQAAESYAYVLEQNPEDCEIIQVLHELYREIEDYDRLQEILLKAVDLAQNSEEKQALMLEIAENADQHLMQADTAIEYYRQILAADAKNENVIKRLESLYESQGNYDDLIEILRAHMALCEGEEAIALRVKLAEIADGQLGNEELAIENLNAVLEINPDHAAALTVLARLYERRGDSEKAAETLAKALNHANTPEERADTQRRLGFLYLRNLDRREDGLTALRAALDETGDAEALKALLAEAKKDKDNAEIARLLEISLKKLEGAARVPALQEIAALALAEGDKEKQIKALEEAAELAPKDTKLQGALLDAWIAAGQLEKAEPLLQKIIADLKAARRNRELAAYNFRLGCMAEARGDEEAARKIFTECKAIDATDVNVLLHLGKLNFRAERWEDALKDLQTLLLHQMKLSNEGKIDVFYHLGRVRAALGDPRRAKDMYDRALRINPDHELTKAAKAELG